MRSKGKCTICNEEVSMQFKAMKEWSIDGVLCEVCYSKKLGEFYPGDHERVNKD